jgi:hypothetical protein
MFSKPMVRSAQTVHLLASRLGISPNGPKWASTWASSAWSTIRCTQNNYWVYGTFGVNHAPILHWHYHRLQTKWNEVWHDPRHLGVPSGASKMISEPMVRSAQPCTYLASRLALSLNGPKRASTCASSPWSTIGCVQNDFLILWYVWCKACTYLALTLTLSLNKPNQDSTEAMSPKSSIGFVQNDFQAYGMFGANHAPILRQDYQYLQTDQNELPLEPRHLGVLMRTSLARIWPY